MCFIIGYIKLHIENITLKNVAPCLKVRVAFERNAIKAIKESETFVLLLIDNQKLSNAQVSNDSKMLLEKIMEETYEEHIVISTKT